MYSYVLKWTNQVIPSVPLGHNNCFPFWNLFLSCLICISSKHLVDAARPRPELRAGTPTWTSMTTSSMDIFNSNSPSISSSACRLRIGCKFSHMRICGWITSMAIAIPRSCCRTHRFCTPRRCVCDLLAMRARGTFRPLLAADCLQSCTLSWKVRYRT